MSTFYSLNEYTGDGSTTQYAVNFTLDYINKSDVAVFVDGTPQAFTWISDGLIQLTTAPSNGAFILIKRNTDLTSLINDYQNGSVIIEQNLDDSFKQTVLSAQEALDSVSQSITVDAIDGKWQASDRIIKNVKDGVDTQDAVNVGQLTTHDATIVGYKDAAEASAIASANSATASATSAVEAQATLDEFQGQYHGALATAPTTGLDAGDLYFDTALDEMQVYDGTKWKAAVAVVNGTAIRQSYTATASQTTFTVTGGYDAGFADVYLNGVKLVNGVDVNVTSGTDVVLTTGATEGDSVDVIAYGSFEVANTYTQAQVDALLDTRSLFVQSIDLLPDAVNDGTTIEVNSYYGDGQGGGGTFFYDASMARTEHNGGTIIDPSLDMTTPVYESTNTGTGVWRRNSEGTLSPKCFGAKADGTTDDLEPMKKAILYGAIDDVENTFYVTNRLYANNDLRIGTLRLEAIGGEWANNTANVDTDTVGKPLLTVSATLDFNHLEINGGLETIDPNTDPQNTPNTNNTIASAGVVFNDGARVKGKILTVTNCLGYQVWTRGKVTDSSFYSVRTSQWNWGSAGWYDVSRRTAYGFANTSGDFHVVNLTSNYNKANVYCTTAAFTTQWTSVHVYNGSDEAAALDTNIVINEGASGQVFNNVYLDNGGVTLRSFNHIFGMVRGVKTSNSGHYKTFNLIATQASEAGAGLQIGMVQTATNIGVVFSTEGVGSWVDDERKACVIGTTVKSTPFADGQVNGKAFNGLGVVTNHADATKVHQYLSSYEAPIKEVSGRNHIHTVYSQGYENGYASVNYSPSATGDYPAFRCAKARSADMSAMLLGGDYLGEFMAVATNGTDFTHNKASGGIRVTAFADHSVGSQPTTVQVWLTAPNSNISKNSYVFNGNEFRATSDNSKNLGTASFRWQNIYAATGAINTSDARLKTFEDIQQAESECAKELKGLIRKFKFNDAIEEKGNSARIHFGVSAQEVKKTFEKYGLAAEEYSLLCYDEWDDQFEKQETKSAVLDNEGTVIEQAIEEEVLVVKAGNRYGIRYEELLCFIVGAL